LKVLSAAFYAHPHFPENDPLNLFSESFADNSEELNDEFLGALRLSTNLSILSSYETRKTEYLGVC